MIHIEIQQQLLNRLGTHTCVEFIAVFFNLEIVLFI